MKLSPLLYAFLLIILFTSCTKVDDVCEISYGGCITLDQPFFLSQGNPIYFKIDENEHIKIQFESIDDNRVIGELCSSSTGGNATTFYSINYKNKTTTENFTASGCRGNLIPNPESLSLQNFTIGNYKLFQLKIYPISNYMTEPISQDQYDVLLLLSKN